MTSLMSGLALSRIPDIDLESPYRIIRLAQVIHQISFLRQSLVTFLWICSTDCRSIPVDPLVEV